MEPSGDAEKEAAMIEQYFQRFPGSGEFEDEEPPAQPNSLRGKRPASGEGPPAAKKAKAPAR